MGLIRTGTPFDASPGLVSKPTLSYEWVTRGESSERTHYDPKDGDLCLARMKPGETLVEVRSDSDVQIDRLSWV